jgi:4'-phosphopantetheinyl transferase EntD
LDVGFARANLRDVWGQYPNRLKTMIEEILPDGVVVIEARDDSADAALFPEEEALLASAIEKRRREFATGRRCAHAALQQLGYPPGAILRGSRGEPLWPEGVVGSITHCDQYRAAAVARSEEIVTLGIDAEHDAALPDGVLEQIARPEELGALCLLQADSPEVHWDRLLFSAKESVYKAWFPLTARWLGFEDVSVLLSPSAHTFLARLSPPGPVPADDSPLGLSGSWKVDEGLVLTAVVTVRDSST